MASNGSRHPQNDSVPARQSLHSRRLKRTLAVKVAGLLASSVTAEATSFRAHGRHGHGRGGGMRSIGGMSSTGVRASMVRTPRNISRGACDRAATGQKTGRNPERATAIRARSPSGSNGRAIPVVSFIRAFLSGPAQRTSRACRRRADRRSIRFSKVQTRGIPGRPAIRALCATASIRHRPARPPSCRTRFCSTSRRTFPSMRSCGAIG